MDNIGDWRGFRYAMCNESLQDYPFEDQCRVISEAGYRAIEIAPFTLVKNGVQEISSHQRKQMLAMVRNHGLVCNGLHWLFTPPPHDLHFTTPDKQRRDQSVAYLHELIDFCGDLEGEVMIFGSPQQRSTDGISVDEAKKYFAEGLARVANHARDRGVMLLVEHLDHTQSDVVNTLAEAKELMEMVGHPAIRMMFDFHNTADETEALAALIRHFYDSIEHVHVQEMDGRHLGTGGAANDFVEAFQALKDLRYDRWVSLEVFDFSPGGANIAKASMQVLKEIESKLD
jgi:sugar phosphate isomerase/epimerase